jgi:methyl-accepting chemotaxis protein
VDQAAQRSASAAEELASTAAQLAGQAEALQSQVRFFRLPGASNGAGPVVHALPHPVAPAQAALA